MMCALPQTFFIHVPCQTNLVFMGYHRHLVEELSVEEQELKSCCSLVPSWSLGLGAAPWCATLKEHSSVYPCKVKIFGVCTARSCLGQSNYLYRIQEVL